MESLLSLAFDNLSSFDGAKIRKGLKQVEGLLAQICLSGPSSPRKDHHHQQQQQQGSRSSNGGGSKGLADLSGDPAFREFFKLQEGFEWNIAQRLLTTLDWLVVRGGDGQYDLLIVNALDLIQGVLLLHPPSKALFSRSVHMNVRLSVSVSVFLPNSFFFFFLEKNPVPATDSLRRDTAPPRPPRAHQLPGDPVGDRHHAGGGAGGRAAERARL